MQKNKQTKTFKNNTIKRNKCKQTTTKKQIIFQYVNIFQYYNNIEINILFTVFLFLVFVFCFLFLLVFLCLFVLFSFWCVFLWFYYLIYLCYVSVFIFICWLLLFLFLKKNKKKQTKHTTYIQQKKTNKKCYKQNQTPNIIFQYFNIFQYYNHIEITVCFTCFLLFF